MDITNPNDDTAFLFFLSILMYSVTVLKKGLKDTYLRFSMHIY